MEGDRSTQIMDWSCQPVHGAVRHTEASGEGLGRRPAGGVSRTAARYQRRGASPRGGPAGVSHATVAQVRTDLQAISHAERKSSY
jgi:hypothetical protein